MNNKFSFPKSIFLSFLDQDFERINNIPVYSYDKTLEEISQEKPILAINFINNELLYNPKIKPEIQIVSNFGNISSKLDGDQVALGALAKVIEKSIKSSVVVDSLDFVLSTYVKMGLHKDTDHDYMSIPKFIISLKSNSA